MACKYTYNGVEYSKEQLVSKLGNENSNFNTLYNNLVNEITNTETGRKVLDRIKKDYDIKTSKYQKLEEENDINHIESVDTFKIGNDEYKYEYKEFEEYSGYYPSFIKNGKEIEFEEFKKAYNKNIDSLSIKYTLEEQQEEAIVELLGLMTAEKLDNVKDGKLISLLKRLLKEIKAFVKDLFKQREVEIDKLPDNMTLGDLSDLLAYSNSKLILPGYEVEYTTPDNTKFKTYAEASKHISNLVKGVKDVDLSNIKINEFNNIPDEFETPGGIAFKKDGKYYLKELYPNFDEKGNFIDETENIIEISNDRFISQYKDSFDYHLYDKNLSSFIERNKEYEQSKDIIEEWKKINNIQYNPEEIYSRGQEFTSVVGAYSSFDVNLMMQNLLTHIEDNEKAGGKFAISAYTKPVGRTIGHLDGGGGKIKFKIYPKSEDILWASNVDVYSGSVWDASEKINKDKKSELLGVSYTKYPALNNVNTVQPNLAAIIDNIAHHHNELGIVLTGNNFRLEYDEDIPHQTKKIIDNINAILDYRYGKLAKPNINKPVLQKVFAVFYQSEVMEDDGAFSHYEDVTMKRFDNEKDAQDFIDSDTRHYNYRIKSYNQERTLVGIQPKQTNETLKESINSVKDSILKDSYKEIKGWGLVVNDKTINNKEYTSQALINTKIAALKEVAKKYPRSLIRSEVKSISDSNLQNNKLFDDELPFQKIPGQEASSIYELTQPEQYEQRANFSELSDFIRKETKLGKVTATDTTVLKRLLSSSSKLVFGTYYFDRSGDTDVFETSDKSTISYVTDSSLYSKIDNRPIQEIFSIYGHTAMETKLGIMSSIVERLHSDNFNGKLFRYINSRVGGVEIRIVENTGKGMFVSDNNLYIDLQGVSNTIVSNNISDISEYLNTVLSEELIHLVVDSYITNEDYQNIYNETPKNIIDGIQQVYMFVDPTVNIVVDEYLRMLIQDHFFGKTTELIKNQNVEITQPFLYQIFINTWEFIRDFFKKEYPQYTKQVVDKSIEMINESQGDTKDVFQLSTEDVLPNEITPELKSKLHEFASALGIEIKVLDDLIERRGVNGIAQIRDFKILLQNGKESALGEEVAHFLVRLLDNESDLKKRIMEEAPRTRLYKKLRQDAGYKAAYGDNTQLFKEEVAAKLISLYLSDKELFNHWAGSDQLIENLVRWIKDFFKWLRGNVKLNSFIEASQQILDLNTSNLVLSQAADAQEMYSIAEFINRTQKLESVNYDIKNVDKLLINISNTILDYEGYPGDKKEKRAFIFQAGENAERDKFYSTAKLTTLGLELKDKLEFLGDKEIVFYTRMYVSPALETRLMMEFNSNIRIERTNVEQPIFDADGNYITMSDETNTLQDIIDREVAKSPNVRMLAVDNSTISVKGAQARQYNQKTANYKPIKDSIKASYKAKEKLEINDKFKNELSKLNQGQLLTKVEEAFKIINKEIEDIGTLEMVLKKMGNEEVSKLFRDEYGNITLPKKPAQQAIQFIKEMNKLEKGILQFVGTIESVTAFFSERNLTNYQTVRDLIEKANQTVDKKEQDRLYENAIQELALITKMGNSWREYISQFREIIQGYPKTETVQKLLSDLEGQIDQTKRIARELSKEAVSKYLAGKSFDAINLVNKELIAHYDKILQDPGLSKEKREEVELNKSRVRIKNHEDIISIFNGDIKDIDGTTVWVKHLHNSSDSLLGSVNVMIQKAYAEVEVETMQRAQDMGAKVREQMTKANVTQKDIEDNLVISEDFYMEELQPDGSRKWVKKSRLALLNPWQNIHVRFEKKLPMDEAYSKWSEAKKARLLSEEEITNLRKDYEAKRDIFNKWENQNWNRKYLKEFNERYDELLQDERNKELLEEVKKTQQEIYSDINENTLLLQSETDLNNVDHLNSQIEDGYRQLKKLKRDTYDDGSPKVDRDLEIAKLLQKKAEIDRPFYEYSSDTKRFRNDFKVFLSTLSEIPDDVYATMLSKLEGESFSELYEYAVQSAPHQVKIWLDLFTVVRYSPEWYAKRKVVVDQITEVSNQLADAYGKNKTDLGEIWSQLFTLTSPLRDEDNILDGADATPEVQSKVLEFEKEIESIKLLTRMEREGIYSPEIKKLKEELGKLIKDLNELQLSVTTDYYNQAFMEQAENTGFKDAFVAAYPIIPMSYQSNLLDVINTSQFRTFVNDNPDHPFVEWFKNNHLEKTSYNEAGESSLTMVPTYIWYKKEPKDKKEILTLPSHKYSVRKVKEEFVTKKIDWDTWNPITKAYLPLKENSEFKNPAYTKLRTSSDSKNIGLRNILDEVTKFHLFTQANSIVQESKTESGFGLPYMAKKDLDNGFFKNIYNNFIDKQNRFEQGEGNYDETVEPESKKGFLNRVISWLNGWIDDKPDSNESETTKFQRIAVPYTHYMEPERVSKDILLSTTMFAASTGKADRMFKSLNTFKLIEEVLENPPKLDKKGRMTGVNSNRIKSLLYTKEYHIYGVNKKYELGRGIDRTLTAIRDINTIGSLGFPFGFANTLKNNLQGRLQNLIGGRFADWSSPASMRKAAGNLNINFISWIAQSEVEPSKRTLDFHIINYMNPQLSGDIYQHLFSGAGKRIAKDRHIYLLNEGMEFSISVNLLYGHLYHVKVKNKKGEQKTLYDILEFKDGKIRPKEGWITLKGERVVDDQYLLDTKLAYKTAAEYIQGKVVDKDALTQTTIGQALSYFKNWLKPMLRRRFDKKRENYMIGENLEGYWRASARLLLIMTRDFLRDGKLYWNSFTPEEKRNFITAAQETAFMMVSLALLSLAFGFDADDPDKFKKLKNNSYAKNLALLIILGAKNETESLSAMPFVNIEQQAVPPILTEGSKWVKNPTIGFAIIDNTWKTANYTYDLLAGSESAYYKQNMPQYGIEKGDTKAAHYLLKITQFDDLLNNANPERKIQSMISMMKM